MYSQTLLNPLFATLSGDAESLLDGLSLSTLAWQPSPGPEGLRVYDVDGDGYNDLVFGYGTTAVWFKQSSTWRGTFGRRYVIATGFSDIEGLAVGNVDGSGDAAVAIGDQVGDSVTLAMPTTPGDPEGAWSTVALITGRDGVHSILMFDVDGDGLDEIVFCWELSGGGVAWLDFDGVDPMDANDWTEYTIVTGRQARTFAHFCPADIAGNGRQDIVVCQRQGAGQRGVDWYEMPADPTQTWTRHVIVDDIVATWASLGDFSGDGNGLDIATFDQDAGEPRYYTHADDYATEVALPDPGLPSSPQQFDAWNIIGVSGTNRDNLLYATGTSESGSQESHVYLMYYDGSAWQADLITTYDYGHPVESTAERGVGLLSGGANMETAVSDSGSSAGGMRVLWAKPFDLTNALTKTPPTVRASATATSTTLTLTIAKPTGTIDGDLLLCFISTVFADTNPITAPAGWEPAQIVTAQNPNIVVYAKVASSEPASWDWTRASLTFFAGSVLAISGADTSDPFDCWAARRVGIAGTALRCPTMQATEAGVLALVTGSWGTQAQSAQPTYPDGFTVNTYISNQRGHAVGSKQLSVAGDTGDYNLTLATTSTDKAVVGLLVRGL